MSTIIHLQSRQCGKTAAQKLAEATAASGAPADGVAPAAQFTRGELLGVRRFAEVAMCDIQRQVQIASLDPRVPRSELQDRKLGARLITAWLAATVMTIDGQLQEHKLLSEQPEEPVVEPAD